MSEALYAERPDVYDVLYAEKEYDAEVEWVLDELAECEREGDRVLLVGCGTGEHARRLRDRGYDVTGVDRYEAMVERARGKSDAEFLVDALPDLSVGGRYDLVWAPFTVVNHVPEAAFPDAVRSMADRVAGGGLLVVDTMSVPDGETPPRLYSYEGDEGQYARVVQTHAVEGWRHRWDSVVFGPDGFFVDAHDLWNYPDDYVSGVMAACGLDVEEREWYGLEDVVHDGGVFLGTA